MKRFLAACLVISPRRDSLTNGVGGSSRSSRQQPNPRPEPTGDVVGDRVGRVDWIDLRVGHLRDLVDHHRADSEVG